MAIPAFLSSMCGLVVGGNSSDHGSLSMFNSIMAVPSDTRDLLLVHRMDCVGSEENPAIGGFRTEEEREQSPKGANHPIWQMSEAKHIRLADEGTERRLPW